MMTRRGRTLRLAVAAVAVLLLAGVTPAPSAQDQKEKSAEEIVKGLLGPAGEERLTRSIRPQRTDTPGAARSGGRIAVPIQFRLDSAEITPESMLQLQSIVEALNDARLDATRIAVEGHTDSQGADAYNEALSQRRAEAVRRFLVERGSVSPARLEARGFGKSRPLPGVSQETEEGRAKNRRVELVNLGPAAAAADTSARPPAAAPVAPSVAPEMKVNLVVTYMRDGETRTLAPGATLTANDRYRVTFTPSADGYVYVYQLDSRGAADAVFPNPAFSEGKNPVKAKQTYTIPPTGQWLTLDQNAGEEEIVVIAARDELTNAKAIATWKPGQGGLITMRSARGQARDAAPELPPGVFSYRLPFQHR